MRWSSLSLIVSLSALSVAAIDIPFQKGQTRGRAQPRANILKRQSPDNSTDVFQFQNVQDTIYVGTIVVDGNSYEVQLDTGSSDLWINTDGVTFSDNVVSTNVSAGITYGDGTVAQGQILLANVTFGNFTVPQQAFISAPGSNATSFGDKGLMGVGPPSLSAVNGSLISTDYDGTAFITHLFDVYPDVGDYITFLLSRSFSGLTDGGVFTISSLASGYESITDSPQLVVLNPNVTARWITNMTGVSINGQVLNGGSGIYTDNSTTDLVANLDSGTSSAVAPPAYVDAIYGNIPGAQFNSSYGKYLFSCNSTANVSFIFGDHEYFIHPIDLGTVGGIEDGTAICYNSIDAGEGALDDYDFLLGDTFLRNVYSLYDYGFWSKGDGEAPFMQILSITSQDQAYAEFSSLNDQRVQAFNQQNGTTGTSVPSSSSTSVGGSSTPASSVSTTSSPSGSGTTSATGLSSVIPSSTGGFPGSSASSSLLPSGSGTPGKEFVSGAAANDGSSTVDLGPVTRNEYIIMGLVGIVIALLGVNLATSLRKNQGYRQINTMGAPQPHFADRGYED